MRVLGLSTGLVLVLQEPRPVEYGLMLLAGAAQENAIPVPATLPAEWEAYTLRMLSQKGAVHSHQCWQ